MAEKAQKLARLHPPQSPTLQATSPPPPPSIQPTPLQPLVPPAPEIFSLFLLPLGRQKALCPQNAPNSVMVISTHGCYVLKRYQAFYMYHLIDSHTR